MATPADAHPPNALPAGTRLGEFELRRVLGVGGFGIVYLAFDHALEREVAVKEYMPATLAGRTATLQVSVLSQAQAETFALGRRSFVNEARLLARFDHPSLVKVHRYWEANQTAYMAMPYYRGHNLHHVRRSRSQPPDEAWLRTLTEPLLGAIELLHAQDVFHRDISPDNILLQPDGRPVLLDFGAARRVLGDKSLALTAILKPAYAPIEQYAEAGSVKQGPWTDLYALGATLHHLLTGHAPPPATARTVQDDMVPLADQRLAGCSPAFLHAIDWMLRPRPADRPQCVADLRAVLGSERAVPPPAAAGWVATQVMAAPMAPTVVLAPATAMAPTEVIAPTEVVARPAAAGAAPADGPAHTGAQAAAGGVAATTADGNAGPGSHARAVSQGTGEPTGAARGATALQPAPFSADRDRATPPPRRARWPAAAAAAAMAVALAAGLGWVMVGQRSTPSTAAAAPGAAPSPPTPPPAAEPAPAAPRNTAVAMPRDQPAPAASEATATAIGERSTPPVAPVPRAAPAVIAAPTAVARPGGGGASPSATTATASTAPGAARIAATGPSVPGALPPRPQGVAPAVAAMPTLPPTAVATQAGQAAEPMRPVTLASPAPPSPTTAAPTALPAATSPAPAPTRPLPAPPADPMVQARVLGPSERCEGRVLLALYTCIESQCNRMPELRDHPECVKLRRDQEQRAGGVKN